MGECTKEVYRQDLRRQKAESEILDTVIKTRKKYNLTYGDILGILSQLSLSHAKELRMKERDEQK